MADPKKTVHPLASVGGIAGFAGGWILSQYAGSSLWIPGITTLLLFLIFTKTPLRPKFFMGAIAVTGGHIAWFVVGSLIMNMWAATALDILLLSVGIIWLWLGPGLGAALFLGLLQLASLAYNIVSISSAPFGSPMHRALAVHCVWRLLAIVCLVFGYIKMRRERAASASPPPLQDTP
jgi:hypothetical protein